MIKNNFFEFILLFFSITLGGFDFAIKLTIFLLVMDTVTGVLANFGKLKSSVFIKGICKKLYILIIISIAYNVGEFINMDLRNVVIGFYNFYEALSILENGNKLGVPIPKKLKNILESEVEKNA